MATLSLFVYQKPSIHTVMSVLNLLRSQRYQWTLIPENRDALIDRARAIAATRWLMNSPGDDVLVMSDDDFYFTVEGVESLVDLALEKKAIVAGVTPLKSGEYTAIEALDFGPEEPWRDPNCSPMEIRRAGGLIAYHRSVFERMAEHLPLLHKDDVIEPFYPFFMPFIVDSIYLSEDYACHERARQVGVSVWVQPKCQVGHLASQMMVTTKNMDLVLEAYRANAREK